MKLFKFLFVVMSLLSAIPCFGRFAYGRFY